MKNTTFMELFPILGGLAVASGIGMVLYVSGAIPGPNNPLDAVVKVTDKAGGHGSGVFIGRATVLTADHVVSDQPAGSVFNLTLTDGKIVTARVVFEDKALDVAVLKADTPPVNHAQALVNCNPVAVGDNVSTYGYPGDLGLVEAWGRIEQVTPKHLLSSTIIAPGSSGAPLFDYSGQIVGIVRALPAVPVAVDSNLGAPLGLALPFPITQSVSAAAFCKDLSKWDLLP